VGVFIWMNKRDLIGLVIIVGILLVMGFFWFIEWDDEKDLGDVECVKVQTSCCPCNMGGEEKCVLESEIKEYEEKLLKCSEGLICAAVFNCAIESCEYIGGECVSS